MLHLRSLSFFAHLHILCTQQDGDYSDKRFGPADGPIAQRRLAAAEALGIASATLSENDSDVMRLVSERMVASLGINFILSDLTAENGPIRQVRAPLPPLPLLAR
eukprot:COSAG06_NODE_1840_length_8239_cov_3.113145_3_plen_105_part_00